MTSRRIKPLMVLAIVTFGVLTGQTTAYSGNRPVFGIAAQPSQVSPAGVVPLVVAPSGEAMPVGDLPGWHQIFTDDFTTDVPLGSFPAAVSSKWTAYPSPTKDSSRFGTYSPTGIVSISGGVLTKNIHTENGVAMVAAISPKVPGPMTFGRYAVRYRFDSIPGYKMAWMLWPDSNNNKRDGEIDFPEMNLDSSTVSAYNHRTDWTGTGDQAWANTHATLGAWHTAVIEWSPGLVVFRFDGVELGRTSERVAHTAMHWVLQTETALHTTAPPPANANGNVQIDWVAAWAYDAATDDSIAGLAPTFGKAGDDGVAEFWPMNGAVELRTLLVGAWSPPATLASLPPGLSVTSTTVAVGLNNLGNLEVYVVASDGQVWHSYAANGASNWSAFSPLGSPPTPIAGDVSAGTNYLANQELYVRATNGEVFHNFATPGHGSGWSGWDSMGRPPSGVRGDVAVANNYLANQELYIVGNDGRPYHNFATPGTGTGWNGWDPLDGPVAPTGDISAGINYAGNQELYLVGTDTTVWHNYATPGTGSGWAGWSPLGAPANVTLAGDVAVQPHDYSILGQQWIRATANNGVIWQDTQTPGTGTGWSPWSPP